MSTNDIKEYDFICSLGGSCASANNLRLRNLRPTALPFDWFFAKDNEPFLKLIDCLNCDFENFLIRENLEELKGDERGLDYGHFQYKDNATGYRIIHAFDKSVEDVESYKKVKKIFDRRIKRFYRLIKNSNKVLFVVDAPSFKLDIENLKKIRSALVNKFGDKDFDFLVFQFEADNSDIREIDSNIIVRNISRKTNYYDFEKTNEEWNFLDKYRLSKKGFKNTLNFFKIKKIKRGFSVHLLERMCTIIDFKIYLLGICIKFNIGCPRS